MRRIKTAAAVVITTVLTTFSTVGASTEPPTATQETSTEAPATEAVTTTEVAIVVTDPPTTEAQPDSGTTEAPTTEAETTAPAVVAEESTSTANPNQIDQDQTVVITATIVGNANTGGNTIVDNGPSGGSQLPAEVDSGDAAAVGSQDANVVTQGADITLEDQAVANVIQVALIINIGVALANSGYNGVGSTPGGQGINAGIVTGDASAEGLDIDQYITQAARERGDENTDAHAGQLAISLWMGLGTANSGLNTVAGTGVGGSGGSIGSGTAVATGNISTTDIDQYAELLGEDTAELNVTQRATVLNVGFALANSGINEISGVAGGLLSADPGDDNEYAQDLFAMLLPALLQSYGYGPGAGSIGTGNASAVGNDSDTFIKQVALAASSGDGVVDIVQQVLVANMGAAGANTGGNHLGGGVATLTADDASAIVMMAAFMSEMLALVHQEANGETMEAVSRGIDVPFQGLLLRLDASFEGLDTTFSNESGARANMRQVTVVISLGLANANTGHNSTQTVTQGNTVNELQTGDAVQVMALDAQGNVIGTGDAEVGADQLVVLCQRINAEDIDCLAPPTTTVPPSPTTTAPGIDSTVPPGGPTTTVDPAIPTTAVSGQGAATTTTATSGISSPPVGPQGYVPGGSLPATGTGTTILIILGAVVLVAGGTVLLMSRKKNEA